MGTSDGDRVLSAPAGPVATERTAPGGAVVLGVVVVGWIVTLWRYLRHRVLLSFDTVNNYAHVWYVADRFWHHGQLPLRMPVLGHGRALAFPYGFLPWTSAALLRPLLGDWTVTLWMALGAVGMAVATFAAFPELRRGWEAAAVLLNPAVVQAGLFGQLSFSWAATLLLAGVACWRRGRPVAAVVLVGLAEATHPVVLLPLVGMLVLGRLPFEAKRARLIGAFALTIVVAAPAAGMALISPVFDDATVRDIVVNFISTVATRGLAIAVPVLAAVVSRRRLGRAAGPAILAAVVLLNLALYRPMRVANGVRSLRRHDSAASMVQFLRTPAFVPHRTYRVLRDHDARLGLYRLIQAGGRLDSEFFPEGMAIRSFGGARAYQELLCERRVDDVLAFASYDHTRHTNEHRLLRELARLHRGPVRVRVVRSSPDLDVFAVDRTGCRSRS